MAKTDLITKTSMEEAEDEDSVYCRCLIPILKKLPTKKKLLLRSKLVNNCLIYSIMKMMLR